MRTGSAEVGKVRCVPLELPVEGTGLKRSRRTLPKPNDPAKKKYSPSHQRALKTLKEGVCSLERGSGTEGSLCSSAWLLRRPIRGKGLVGAEGAASRL